MRRLAPMLLVVALTGCVLLPPSPPDERPPTPPTRPAPTEACGDLGVIPERADVTLWQTTHIRLTFTNCGATGLTLARDELCSDTGLRAWIAANGTEWPLLHGASARAGESWWKACGDIARAGATVPPGAAAVESLAWNGTLSEGMDLRQNVALPPGTYEIVARARTEDGRSWETRAPLRLLPSSVPLAEEDPAVVFVIDASYHPGETVSLQVRNVGNRTYAVNPDYEACAIWFYTDEGRPFVIPQGTHCDLVGYRPIVPGETVFLFDWSLDECAHGARECAQRSPLPPGTYHLRGAFHPWRSEYEADRGNVTRPGVSFRIVEQAG